MSKQKIYPLSDLERFEVMQAMFPDEIGDENEDWNNIEDTIWEKFEIAGEDFDQLVGHLVMLAPIQQSPMSGELHHVLGTIKIADNQQLITAAVKREVQIPQEPTPENVSDDCDHDWEDMGDGTKACTYPECDATRPKDQSETEAAQ